LFIPISEPRVTLLVLYGHVRVLDHYEHDILEETHGCEDKTVHVELSKDESELCGALEKVRDGITVHHTVQDVEGFTERGELFSVGPEKAHSQESEPNESRSNTEDSPD
jgi:hypothetical protein